jgi:hypothetical protein
MMVACEFIRIQIDFNDANKLFLFSVISLLIALILYPVCFAAELNLGNRAVWEFGWAYGGIVLKFS